MRASRIMKLVAAVSSSISSPVAPASSASTMAAAWDVLPEASSLSKQAVSASQRQGADERRQAHAAHRPAILGTHAHQPLRGDATFTAVARYVVVDPERQRLQQGRLAVVAAAHDQRDPGADAQAAYGAGVRRQQLHLQRFRRLQRPCPNHEDAGRRRRAAAARCRRPETRSVRARGVESAAGRPDPPPPVRGRAAGRSPAARATPCSAPSSRRSRSSAAARPRMRRPAAGSPALRRTRAPPSASTATPVRSSTSWPAGATSSSPLRPLPTATGRPGQCRPQRPLQKVGRGTPCVAARCAPTPAAAAARPEGRSAAGSGPRTDLPGRARRSARRSPAGSGGRAGRGSWPYGRPSMRSRSAARVALLMAMSDSRQPRINGRPRREPAAGSPLRPGTPALPGPVRRWGFLPSPASGGAMPRTLPRPVS